MNIASLIDHTLLKQTTILQEVEKLCSEALEYGFAAVCIPPVYVQQAARQLAGRKVKVATVIGFPFGYSHARIKTGEAQQAIIDGAQEIDMVMNICAFKNGDLAYLRTEVAGVSKLAKKNGAVLKVIIESGILTNEEIIQCCELYSKFPVDFVKTSTGYAEKGATIEAVQLMRQHLPSLMGIKASGGIRTFDFAQQLVKAGATRLGCSASVAIVKGEEETSANWY